VYINTRMPDTGEFDIFEAMPALVPPPEREWSNNWAVNMRMEFRRTVLVEISGS
jgi:hypothetical protein